MHSKSQDDLAEFERRCRDAGIKVTAQRVALYRRLSGAEDHPDAEALYRELSKDHPHLSRDTVYRTLASFESMGLIRRLPLSGSPYRYDPRCGDHDHAWCIVCGKVVDLPRDASPPALPGEGFEDWQILCVSRMITVRCDTCRHRSLEGDHEDCRGE